MLYLGLTIAVPIQVYLIIKMINKEDFNTWWVIIMWLGIILMWIK